MNQMYEAIKDGTAVFVFGSNLAGAHGAEAAAHAVKHWGAIYGQGIGHHGMSYAIPTKNRMIRTMPLNAIRPYVLDFMRYAELHPHLTFKVTQIGCGLAGYKPEDIAPMFKGSPKNCWFDWDWNGWLGADYHYWGSL